MFIVNHLMIEGRIIGVAVAATIITENECILFEVQPPCKVCSVLFVITVSCYTRQ